MYDLLPMDIFQSVTYFADDLFCQSAVNPAVADEVFKSLTVNPIHYYAVSKGLIFNHSIILADSNVIQREADIEVFLQQLFIERLSAIFFFECLIDKEPSVLAASIQFTEPILGCVDEFEIV